MLEDAQKELEKIEYLQRTWDSEFMRQQAIWEKIVIKINSHTGEKQKFWELVMDLYHKKYR